MEQIKDYERNVYYYETDRMGIVHHSNYIKWFEEARIYFLEQIGYPFKRIEDEGLMIPVLSVGCTYRKPMIYGDTFIVKLVPKSFNGIKFFMEYEIYKKGSDDIYVTGESSHCFVDNDMKPILIKKSNNELYNVLNNCFIETKNRKNTLKK